MEIKFTAPINNVSLQVGDTAYFVPYNSLTSQNVDEQYSSTDSPIELGRVQSIGTDYITLDNATLTSDAQTLTSDPHFVMFSKDKTVNNASMLGYYAQVQLKNSSTEEAELFALSSEVTPSSK